MFRPNVFRSIFRSTLAAAFGIAVAIPSFAAQPQTPDNGQDKHVDIQSSVGDLHLGNDADAEEIVQEAMLRVWVNAPRWRPDAAFRTWLYRVAFNLCLNRRRQKTFAALDAAGDPPDPSPSAADELEKHEMDRFVAKAIGGLPDRQRAAIVLTYYEGLSNAEVASVLETTISSVEALLVRAKRTLRAELGAIPGAAN